MTTTAEKCGFFARLFGKKAVDPRLAELYSEEELAKLLQKYYPSGLPTVSIVSVLYKKAYSIPMFLEAIFRQSYAGPIEILFVGDKSPDHSIAVARKNFRTLEKAFADKNDAVTMRLFTNSEKLGNCASLNVGLEKAIGDIVIFADADCLFNKWFVGHHVLSLAMHGGSISKGPGNIKARSSTSVKQLMKYEQKPSLMLVEAEKAENTPCTGNECNSDTHIFCDCKTRNFSAIRTKLPVPLFQESKTCVEGQDMGEILEQMGLKLVWTPGGFTLKLPVPIDIFFADDDDDDDD